MRTSVKIALITVFFLGLAGILFGIYMFNLKPADLTKARADFQITATDLQKAFEEDENAANARFLQKIVEVTGRVGTIKPVEGQSVNITLETENPLSGVICTLNRLSDISKIKEGDTISIRGRVSGSLMDILLNNCVITGF